MGGEFSGELVSRPIRGSLKTGAARVKATANNTALSWRLGTLVLALMVQWYAEHTTPVLCWYIESRLLIHDKTEDTIW